MNKYQAVIIGFGKAGKTLAVTLAKAGCRVALIEQSNAMYGGTCINIGCIPTKTLVHDAQQHTDFVRAIQRKNEVVNFLRNKNFHNLADMPNIDVIDGQAEFINNHSLRVHRPEGNLEIHGEKIFINTGAQAVVPPIPGITTTPGVYDSTGLLNLKELPGHLGILGGGYIGVEFVNRPDFPGECFICELRLSDHCFRWKHNKLFLLLPEEYGPAFPAIVDCYTSPPT